MAVSHFGMIFSSPETKHLKMKRFLESNWSQIKGQLIRKYDALSEPDLNYEEGREHQLLRRLQMKLDLTYQELLLEMKKIITSNEA